MEDNRIVDLYWARSESAITETASKYGKYCYAIAYNILCDNEDADESVNDTYLGAWNDDFSCFLFAARHRAFLRLWE